METVQQNGRFTLSLSKFPSNIYSILYAYNTIILTGRNITFLNRIFSLLLKLKSHDNIFLKKLQNYITKKHYKII